LSLLAGGLWAYGHRQHAGSALALWLVSFVILSVLFEFGKGVQARMRNLGESALAALSRLLARSRRRYGGYLVHLGVVMVALAFVGDAFFKQETQGPLVQGESLNLAGYSLRYEGLRQYNGSDGREVLEAGLARGLHVSWSGMITFRNWNAGWAVALVPDELLLVETDAPYLAPVPNRGKRNEPAFLPATAAKLAELRGSTPERIAALTTANAERLFRLTSNV